mgnify:CR=1 FL=1
MRKHFAMIDSNFLRDASGRFDGYDKIVYVMLKDYAGAKDTCFPSVKTLAIQTGWCERRIRKSINKLSKEGIISVKKGGYVRKSSYTL